MYEDEYEDQEEIETVEGKDGPYLTFDDILIVPAYSDIESRQEIDTSVSFLGIDLSIPILSANMDFITGAEMANAMRQGGGLGILHRFHVDEQTYEDEIMKIDEPIYLSLGVRNPKEILDFLKKLIYDRGLSIAGVCIDVAHGHHKKVGDMVGLLKGHSSEEIANLKIIAGNVATLEGSIFLHESGADAIKIGIGAGSVCTTRTVAGVGIPQWSAILECSAIKQMAPDMVVIADGGVRSSGDIAKALAAGADVVMIGNLLAGTDEAPGDIVQNTEDSLYKYKRYRGQASFGSNGERYIKEGIEGLVPYKGPVAPIIQQIKAGLQSSMSYIGARTLPEFREKSRIVKVSSHTLMESNTRVTEV